MTRSKLPDAPLLDLMRTPPIARNTDPVTSHLSAEETTRRNREGHCRALLTLIFECPGLTAGEYAARSGIEGAWKRISDLVRTEQAYYAGTAISPLTGRHCGRIWPKR